MKNALAFNGYRCKNVTEYFCIFFCFRTFKAFFFILAVNASFFTCSLILTLKLEVEALDSSLLFPRTYRFSWCSPAAHCTNYLGTYTSKCKYIHSSSDSMYTIALWFYRQRPFKNCYAAKLNDLLIELELALGLERVYNYKHYIHQSSDHLPRPVGVFVNQLEILKWQYAGETFFHR